MLQFTQNGATLEVDLDECYFDGDSFVIYGYVVLDGEDYRLLAVADSDATGVDYQLCDAASDQDVDLHLPIEISAQLDKIASNAFAAHGK